MLNQFSRTQLLIGKDALQKLKGSRVAVFGIGGVGGYVCEALVRSGIGAFDLVDDDRVCLSNLNRQIIATHKTIGKYKVEAMKERMLEINPDVDVRIHPCFFLPENADDFPFEEYDYVVDAVDTVTAKLEIIMRAKEKGIPVLGIVNVVGSSIARESDYCLYTYAGPEISVATTKAYSAQLIVSYLLAIKLGRVKGLISQEKEEEYIAEMETLPEKIEKTLEDKERIQIGRAHV